VLADNVLVYIVSGLSAFESICIVLILLIIDLHLDGLLLVQIWVRFTIFFPSFLLLPLLLLLLLLILILSAFYFHTYMRVLLLWISA
jgi:hypothetical protein